MKAATIFHLLLGLFLNFSLAFCPALLPDPAQAQDDNAEPAEKYSREELAQILAPISLYKAICHFPSILALMSERISQTTNIGNAFLVQEAEVMNMIQELRARARQQGNLSTNAEQKVLVERETIIIEPANPRVIYVPYYDPFSIYGPWWYGCCDRSPAPWQCSWQCCS